MTTHSAPILSINRYDIQYQLNNPNICLTNKQINEIADMFKKLNDDPEFWEIFENVLRTACIKVLGEDKLLTE